MGWLGCYGWLVAVLAIKCTLVRVLLESFFSPLFIETMGAMGPKSMALLREVGRRVAAETGEPRSTDYLLHRLSVAVQRGNCASVLGSIAT